MKKLFVALTSVFAVCFATFTTAYFCTRLGWLMTLSITFGTVAYHFVMRLAVGGVVNAAMHNNANYCNAWFAEHKGEARFFKLLGVRRWKKHVRSYDPKTFDTKLHSLEQIVMASCQAEIVHEIIMVLSLLPIVCVIWFGQLWVFVATSVASFLFDSIFVIVQRYNRPRLLKLLARQKEKGYVE